MNINIENLTINVFVNGEFNEPPYDPSWDFPEDAAAAEEALYEAQDEEVTPAPYDYWDDIVEDAVAEQPTFEPKSLVRVKESYWTADLRYKIGRVLTHSEGGSVLVEFYGWGEGHNGNFGGSSYDRWFIPDTELEPYTLTVGDKVIHMGDGTGDASNYLSHAYTGYTGESLVGKVGTVLSLEGFLAGEVLVEWEDWTDGHDRGPPPYAQGKNNRWYTIYDNLNVVNSWNS